MKIGIIYDCKKPEAKKLALKVKKWLKNKKQKVFFNLNAEVLKNLDFVITFGGDGLVLCVANKVAEYEIPLLRINFGRVGFLTSLEPKEIFEKLKQIIDEDNYIIVKRNRIEVSVKDKNKNLIVKKDALNDVIIERTSTRAIICEIVVNGEDKKYYGDGIIFATRTGSTAYAESAGGPTLIKDNKFILRVISSSDREQLSYLIKPDDAIFKINQAPSKTRLAVDGAKVLVLRGDEQIVVCKSPQKTLFIEIGDRKKLKKEAV